MPAGGMMPGDLAAAGTPSNLGKIGDSGENKRPCSFAGLGTDTKNGNIALADADPLGVNQNVTFDEVGGLEDRQY